MNVTQKEIVGMLYRYANILSPTNYAKELLDRVEREGIAPPDGYAIVPIEPTKAMVSVITNERVVYDSAQHLYSELLTAAKESL